MFDFPLRVFTPHVILLKCIFNFQLARVNSSLIEITSAHIYCR